VARLSGPAWHLTTSRSFRQEIGGDVLPIVLEARDGRLHGRMRWGLLRLAPPLESLEPLAEALGLAPSDLLADPPPRAADTGAANLMVRACTRQAVDRAEPKAEKLVNVLGPAGAEGCYVYALDPAQAASPTRGSSIRPSACGKTPRPAPADRSLLW
jgi:predicted PhzF superfamily epimerase YddE/YHI9